MHLTVCGNARPIILITLGDRFFRTANFKRRLYVAFEPNDFVFCLRRIRQRSYNAGP